MNFNIDELRLIHFADPSMSVKPIPFDFEVDKDKAVELSTALYTKMKEFGGAGISANQLGLPYRVFVIGNAETSRAFFNPTIIGVSKEEVVMEERSLSFPDFSLSLRRPEIVSIEYQDDTGASHTDTFSGVAARIILHEYDHMEGRNFMMHSSNFKFKLALTRWKKKQKKLRRLVNNGK